MPEKLPVQRASLLAADPLMSALGRPNREQVVTVRPAAYQLGHAVHKGYVVQASNSGVFELHVHVSTDGAQHGRSSSGAGVQHSGMPRSAKGGGSVCFSCPHRDGVAGANYREEKSNLSQLHTVVR